MTELQVKFQWEKLRFQDQQCMVGAGVLVGTVIHTSVAADEWYHAHSCLFGTPRNLGRFRAEHDAKAEVERQAAHWFRMALYRHPETDRLLGKDLNDESCGSGQVGAHCTCYEETGDTCCECGRTP